MSSCLISRLRICQKALKHSSLQGRLSVFTREPSSGRSLQLPLSACFLFTRHHPGSRQAHGGWGGVKSTFRENKAWDQAVNGRGMSSSIRQRPVFPRSVFAAGMAKRRAEILMRKGPQAPQEKEPRGTPKTGRMPPPDRALSVAEWREQKEAMDNPKRFTHSMMIALKNSEAQLDIAKSLLTFEVTETGKLSYELLLLYLSQCISHGQDAEVFDVYDIMRASFPSLETGATSLFIKAFSRTSRWREAVSILHEVKKIFRPSLRNYGDVISAAIFHGDAATAWALYDEIIEEGLMPREDTWEALFKGARETDEEKGKQAECVSQSEHEEKLLEILHYMRNNQIYPKQSLAHTIKIWFESLTGQKWTGGWAGVTPEGRCSCCGSELESIHLTAEEYQHLKDRVMTDIIQGGDVFRKTTPQELERFKKFMKSMPAFDVVVDGLNVANSNPDKSKQSATLLMVVSELERRGLKVLVLGKKHMLRPSRSWHRFNMDLIQQKAQCFFTDNISKDDPFLLYATLHSGNDCRFVSKDLMRDHKACLSDGRTRRLFFKWQRGHQLVVAGQVVVNRRVPFLNIPKYDTIIQTSADSWHLPYDDTDDRCSYEVPQRWLCLTKKH